jgi:hypothetical protein
VRLIEGLGYSIEHADDITQRDIEIGWQVLDRQLTEHELECAWLLSGGWVHQARTEFAQASQTTGASGAVEVVNAGCHRS